MVKMLPKGRILSMLIVAIWPEQWRIVLHKTYGIIMIVFALALVHNLSDATDLLAYFNEAHPSI